MKLSSQRFGELEISDDKIITFPEGLIGLPELRRFAIVEHSADTPLHWLLSLDEPELAFVIIDPTLVVGQYQVALSKVDVEKLELAEDTETAVFTLVVIPEDPREMTTNIKGPLVINVEKMIGRQVIQDNAHYSTKHKIFGQGLDAKTRKTKSQEKKVISAELAQAAL